MFLGHSGCDAPCCHCLWEEGRRRGWEEKEGRREEGRKRGRKEEREGQREEEGKLYVIQPSGYLDSCSVSMTSQSIQP